MRDTKIYGRHACRAAFEQRPAAILRVFITESARPMFRDVLRVCASQHKPYRVVPPEELEKVSGARHHEGVCFVMEVKSPRPLTEIFSAQGTQLVLALDGVGNPHNIGTLLRSTAHFGGSAVLIGGETTQLPPAAYRTAEGGAEFVDVIYTRSLTKALTQGRTQGFTICATSSHEGADLYEAVLPSRMILMFGSERHGLSSTLQNDADLVVQIPGSGQVESLNVASSAAIIMAEHWRTKRSIN